MKALVRTSIFLLVSWLGHFSLSHSDGSREDNNAPLVDDLFLSLYSPTTHVSTIVSSICYVNQSFCEGVASLLGTTLRVVMPVKLEPAMKIVVESTKYY
jgi:hypothetical protein